MVTAATAETGEYCYLLSFAFSGGTLYLTTASTDIDWNGNTYQAIGGLTFEAVRETREFTDQSLRVTLDGVDQTVITKVLQQNYIGQTATLHIAHFSSGAIISNPVQLWSGYMNDAWQIRESHSRGGGTSRITTSIVSPFVIFRQTRGIRANVPSHSSIYSGDLFWRHLLSIQGRPIYWGQAAPIEIGAGGSGTIIPGDEGLDDNDLGFVK
jgi:hypothetical protein